MYGIRIACITKIQLPYQLILKLLLQPREKISKGKKLYISQVFFYNLE